MQVVPVPMSHAETTEVYARWWNSNITHDFAQATNLGSFSEGELEALGVAIRERVDSALESPLQDNFRVIILIDECPKTTKARYATELLDHLPGDQGCWGKLYGTDRPHNGLHWYPPNQEEEKEIGVRFIEWSHASHIDAPGGIPYKCIAAYGLAGIRKEIWDEASH
jgi:hypothetical protein